MREKKLSAAEIERLRKLALAKKSIPEIAGKVRCSQINVIRYFRKWKLPVPPAPSRDHVTNEDIEEAVYNYNYNRISYDKSATALGITEIQLKTLVKNYLDEQFLERLPVSSNGNGKINLNDPRSAVCQKIKRCSHHQCHLHRRCPAYENYLMRRN